ncbi:hypothetical protein [Dactylosporangium sp. NPDC051484]|uniref:hypothetical protein n=1 Tax=Dactylosporangium sp. NPDC051484 TaxID=3154942 RepID=UPI00344E4108
MAGHSTSDDPRRYRRGRQGRGVAPARPDRPPGAARPHPGLGRPAPLRRARGGGGAGRDRDPGRVPSAARPEARGHLPVRPHRGDRAAARAAGVEGDTPHVISRRIDGAAFGLNGAIQHGQCRRCDRSQRPAAGPGPRATLGRLCRCSARSMSFAPMLGTVDAHLWPDPNRELPGPSPAG